MDPIGIHVLLMSIEHFIDIARFIAGVQLFYHFIPPIPHPEMQ